MQVLVQRNSLHGHELTLSPAYLTVQYEGGMVTETVIMHRL